MPAGSLTNIIRFENIDIRCSISNVEQINPPNNTVYLNLNYCNIIRSSFNKPIIQISGTSTSKSTAFFVNTRSNGTSTDGTLAVYDFTNTNVYMEECRWNGTPQNISMMKINATQTGNITFAVINCELRFIASTLTTIPMILLNNTNNNGIIISRFSNTQLVMEYTTPKGVGANLISISSNSTWNNSNPLSITLDNCYCQFSNASAFNFILQNLSTAPRIASLIFQRPSNLSLIGGNSGIDYTNINVTNTSAFLNRQLPVPLLTSSTFTIDGNTPITFDCLFGSVITRTLTVTSAINTPVISSLNVTNSRPGQQYVYIITNNSSTSFTINSNLGSPTVITNYTSPITVLNGQKLLINIIAESTTSFLINCSIYN